MNCIRNMDKLQSIQSETPQRSKSLDRARKRLCSEISPIKTESDNDTIENSLQQIIKRLDKQEEKLDILSALQQTQSKMNEKLDKLQDIETALNGAMHRLDDLETKFTDMDTNVENVWTEINVMKNQIANIEKNNCTDLKSKEQELCYLQSALIQQQKELKLEYTKLKDYSQRHNLLFFGIPEGRNENCKHIIDDFIRRYMGLPGAWREIDKAHRYGNTQRGKQRPIIVRFKSHSAKEVTLNQSSCLRGTHFSVRPHLSEDTQRSANILYKAQRLGKNTDSSCKVTGSKLVHKGKHYDIENIQKSEIPVHTIHQRDNGNAVGFLGFLSPLSNFHPCDLKVNGYSYKSVEHFYQVRRAELCNERELSAKLHVMDTAREVKQSVNDFKRKNPGKLVLPEKGNLEIMKTGLAAKFQCHSLRDFLLATGNKAIVECNAYDTFWSCGFGLDNPDFAFRSKWKGKNHLGNLLQELRSDLMRDNRE